MARQTSRTVIFPDQQSAGPQAVTPTSFIIQEAIFTANNGESFEFTDLVQKVTVQESLYTASLDVEIYVFDAVNFLESVKISANEAVSLLIQRSESGDSKKFEIDLNISEIMHYSKPKPGAQIYVLKCVSPHTYMNSLIQLNRSFKGSIGNEINQICKDMGIPDDRKTVNSQSKEVIQGIYPKLRPVQAIRWLTRNSFDDNTPFFFYETLKGGIYFDSYKSMIEKEDFGTYTHSPFFEPDQQVGTSEGYEAEKYKIRKLSSSYNNSQFISAAEGAYASTVHTLDIAKKEYKTYKYSYDNSIKKLNKEDPYLKEMKFKGTSLTDYPESKQYFISLNSKSFGDTLKNYHSPCNPTIHKAEAHISCIDGITQTIIIPGDFDIEVGVPIYIEVLRTEFREENTNLKIDKLLSGRYLIINIKHVFDSKYLMECECKKDSFIAPLNDIVSKIETESNEVIEEEGT